mgnify:CR=1 FL=1
MEFSILYNLHHPELEVCEIKRLGLAPDAPPSEVYQWLVVRGDKAWPLDFKSMLCGEREQREFLEGSLSFTQTHGELKLLGHVFELHAQAPNPRSLQTIQAHLNQQCPDGFRALRPADVHAFYGWLADPEVIRYSLTKFHTFKTRQDIARWFFENLSDPKVWQWGVLDESGEKLIGYAGLAGLNGVDRNGEYFILIGDKAYWRRGVATRVTPQIVELGFQQLQLHRIFLTASSANPAALKAYERAGFIFEGQLRDAFFRDGKFSDKMVMGIINEC